MWQHAQSKQDKRVEKTALSICDAAESTSISERKIRELIAADQFPHVRIGGRIIVPLAALKLWLNEQTRGAAHSVSPDYRSAVEKLAE